MNSYLNSKALQEITQGLAFEQVVLGKHKHLFKKNTGIGNNWKKVIQLKADGKLRHNSDIEGKNYFKNDSSKCCNGSFWWWSPPEDSQPMDFLADSSMHGLKYLSQPQRHLSERIFWGIAFVVSLTISVLLINDVWQRYRDNPVIVSFKPTEQDTNTIPFPAITICNMNLFPKSKVERLIGLAYGRRKWEKGNIVDQARKKLQYIESICSTQESFGKTFEHAALRGKVHIKVRRNSTDEDDHEVELMKLLLEDTLSCKELIRLCIWAESPVNCSHYFRPVITDAGACCSFNILPMNLFYKSAPEDESKPKPEPDLNSNVYIKPRWTKKEIETWKEWNYKEDELFSIKNLKYPLRQKRSGLTSGLSILLDPSLEEYFCPISDSVGFRFVMNSPLEMPLIMDFGSAVNSGNELFVEITPEVTLADEEIKSFSKEKRQCTFGTEISLNVYEPYTPYNCFDECVTKIYAEKCNCGFFYSPREDGVSICQPDTIEDYRCMHTTKLQILDTVKQDCNHCQSLCEDVIYNFQSTMNKLLNASSLWGDYIQRGVIPKWAYHNMSIVHFYFGSDTTVPKIRKRLYGTTDLIANTGGLLGLCLGFSVLSAIEVVYFLTLRACWQKSRRKRAGKKIASKFMSMFGAGNKEKGTTMSGA